MSVEVSVAERDSNRLIENQLDQRAEALEGAVKGAVLSYLGPMYEPADDQIKDAVEAIRGGRRRRDSLLLVLLETSGGFITVAERIARIFRHHYRRVDFVVPTYAMSAGTVLVMSGDELLIMDFGSDPALAQPVHDYFRLLSDYRMRRGHRAFVLHTKERHVGY
jgi:ClpP class serine protease